MFEQNINRLFPTAIFMILFELFMIIGTIYLVRRNQLPETQIRYLYLYVFLILVALAILNVRKKYQKNQDNPSNHFLTAVPIIIFFVLLWGAGIVVLDLGGEYAQVTTYVSMLYFMMALLVIHPQTAFIIITVTQVFLYIILNILYRGQVDLRGDYIHLLYSSIMAWLICRGIYSSTYKKFCTDIINQEQTEQLKELNLQLTILSNTDPLTKLANRRHFNEEVKRQWEEAIEKKKSIVIGMLDIDNFKQYNDLYGHQKGDECLAKIADCIKGTLEEQSMIARYGGEEFIVCILGDTSKNSIMLMEKVRAAVEELKIPHEGGADTGVVTVSIGEYRAVPREKDEISEFIKYADDALYQSKQNGKNRVTMSGNYKSG